MLLFVLSSVALYQGRKPKLIEWRFILLFEVLPIDDKDDYYAESARPRVKNIIYSSSALVNPKYHPLYYHYTNQPKENLYVLPDLRH